MKGKPLADVAGQAPHHDAMRLTELTSTEIADLLTQMYAADHGHLDDALSQQQRTELADYLGCHEDARARAWEAWALELNPANWDATEYWLDVEFVEPCPEGQAV
ncbi:TerB family tellurite resistance protein [Deinococcus saxicola]|uniref:hypothetical protein n=1 Tax=Deinococcus saxicola TaxID=249406 RepID=UPI0039EE26E8